MTKIYLSLNNAYRTLNTSEQSSVESTLRMIPGTRVEEFKELGLLIESEQFQEGSLVIPIVTPSGDDVVRKVLAELRAKRPFKRVFGLLFLLIPSSTNDEKNFSSDEWIETLDQFYEQSIPVNFVVCTKKEPHAFEFHLRANLSSQLREIENILEIQKLERAVNEQEEALQRIDSSIQKQLSR